MRRAGKIAVCLAAGLVFNTGLRADDDALPGNPYAPVVARNVFGLVPVPVAAPAPPEAPPLTISPDGIMSIFGHLQVLFKVTGKAPGKVDSYILTEGEEQDNIEVTKIDEKNNTVTFNNNGTVQTLPLPNANPISGGVAAGSGGNPGAPAFNPNNGNSANGGGFGRFGQRGGQAAPGGQGAPGGNNLTGGATGGANGPGAGDNLFFQPTPPSRVYQPSLEPDQTPMSAEEQVIMIEAQRLQYKNEGSPIANILPPTPLTPKDTDPSGGPLVDPRP